MPEKIMSARLLRFMIVGAITYALYIIVLTLSLSLFPGQLGVATILSYVMAWCFHYSVNKLWTFKDRRGLLLPELFRYAVIYLSLPFLVYWIGKMLILIIEPGGNAMTYWSSVLPIIVTIISYFFSDRYIWSNDKTS